MTRKCEVQVWSRVTGFFRPVQDWNNGKVEEFKARNKYKIPVKEENERERKTS